MTVRGLNSYAEINGKRLNREVDEVNAVDKYEYKLKTEQMLELMNDGAYNKAAEIADAIDWKRIRNSSMLGTVSEIYEKNRDYRKSYDVLRVAYDRAEGSRKIISRLCTLAVKTGNIHEAIDYYDDFIELAPKDPNQFILKYQILRAQRAPIEQQIHALEDFKKAEYTEEWAYELAKLYQEAGMTAECLEECDDLILWFSEGQYVYKTMELKMQYKPLTPSQQEKYDRRFEKTSVSNETEEIPDLTQYQSAEEPKKEAVDEQKPDEAVEVAAAGSEEPAEEEKSTEDKAADEEVIEIEEKEPVVQQPVRKKIGNTMKLDEALKSLLNIKIRTDDDPKEAEEKADDDLTELESEIEEIESVADLGFAEKVAEMREIKLKKPLKLDPDLEELKPQLEEEQALEPEGAAEPEKPAEVLQEEAPADPNQIQGQMSFTDFFDDWGDTGAEETLSEIEEIEEVPEMQEEAPEIEAVEDKEAAEIDDNEILEIDEDDLLGLEMFPGEIAEEADETEEIEEAPEMEELLETDAEEFVEEALFTEEDAEELIEDDAEDWINTAIEQEEGETMENKRNETPILSPDIQRLIDEIEGNIPVEESTDELPEEEVFEETEAEDVNLDDDCEEYFDEYDEEEYEEEEAFAWGAEDAVDAEEAGGLSGAFEEDAEDFEESDYEEYEEDGEYEDEYEEYEEDDEYDLELDEASIEKSLKEEFRPRKYSDEIDDREIPDDDDDGMDILSATTPLSRKETAKLIATGKTAPLPLDEISDALSLTDTGFIVHARYDLKTQSGIGTRAGLTEEQKKLFSYFVPVRGMSEQLVDVLEQDKNCNNREGTSRTGNLLIIGNKGNGKTVLAVDVVKAIQKQRNIRKGKVAIVTGDSLNKKKIGDIIGKLYGGALIIEKAGKMNEKTVSKLNKAMEQDTGELLIVLEDQRKPLDRLLSSNREFRRKFTSRLEVPVFINDELVTFGQTYAQENGYRIDEMSILALYSRIDSLQREDHAVTIAEVKEIMDEAMAHSQKVSAKKLMKRVFGKNTDDADRIILTENDFNL